METLLVWLFYISTLYAFIPGLISRLFGFRVFRRGIADDKFALTFDDGPDPIYTPQLLDLLQQYNAKATFFVVGSNAEKHPEIIKRMHEEGHLIGVHNYNHKTNWLMWPKTVRKHFNRTDQIIYQATGVHTQYYRPPWGIVNLFDYAKKNETQIVLWSAIFNDWRRRVGAKRLFKRMMKKLKGGEVFLLHDCGDTLGADSEAPREMMIALERVLQEAESRGIESIRIDDLIQLTERNRGRAGASVAKDLRVSWFKSTIVSLWMAWEKLFHFIFKLQTTNPENPVFHFRVRPYLGDPILMQDNVTLQKGDHILELHFDNKKLYEIGSRSKSTVHLAIRLIRDVERTLPEIAEYVLEHKELHNVKALYGVSMLNRGPEQFGFTVADLPKGWFARSTKVYLKFMLSVIHPAGHGRLKQNSQQLVPKLMIMPMELLLNRYADHGSHKHKQQAEPNENEPEDIAPFQEALI